MNVPALLKQYVHLMVEEEAKRVRIDEFAAAGGGNALASGNVMGFSGPLGVGTIGKKKRKKLGKRPDQNKSASGR